IGDARALPALIEVGKGSQSFEYAVAAYKLGDSSSLDLIVSKVTSDYSDERSAAVAVLLESRDSRALPALLPLAKPQTSSANSSESSSPAESLKFRLMLAGGLPDEGGEGLAAFKSAEAQRTLVGMIEDPDPQVRAAAVASIGRVLTRSENPESRERALD